MISAKYIHINMDKNKRPKLYTLPDTLPALQRPPPVRSARRGRSSVGCAGAQGVTGGVYGASRGWCG